MKFQIPPVENATDFEDLICDLFNVQNNTDTFKKFGKQGHNQKGIDIFSVEHDIAIQCKKKDLSRKHSLLKKELFDDIEKDVKKIMISDLKIKFNKLFIVTTFENHPDFDELCEDIKQEYNCHFEIIFWGWNTIQDFILKHETILHQYYPKFIIKIDHEEQDFLRNQDLKKQIKNDFKDWLSYSMDKRKRKPKMLIRKFNDKGYPSSNNPNEFGNYDWYNAGIYQEYHKGLEFIDQILEIVSLPNGKWRFAEQGEILDDKYKVYKIGRINYSDIVSYDIDGNNIDRQPHIFCKFLYEGTPYEEIYYVDVDKIYNRFEEQDQEKGN
ncbi:hypothetical protein ACFONJ_21575 [Chryseobacterium tructae]|uniref:Restriction endonuclease type IV Mrr domain-containing protein n=1 Tax=Chryseobacterium tructae TaxID=1037380 RepID=A0ABV7Y4F0_9FLAO